MSTPTFLNRRFEVRPDIAETMWAKSNVLPERDEPQKVDRIRRFSNFVIRKLPVKEINFEPTEHVFICKSELARLSATGISILAHSIAISPDGSRIYTITPYIAGLQKCSPEEFEKNLYEPLERYFDAVPQHGQRLGDIDDPEQFSAIPNLGVEPFLHDVDPYLNTVTIKN